MMLVSFFLGFLAGMPATLLVVIWGFSGAREEAREWSKLIEWRIKRHE